MRTMRHPPFPGDLLLHVTSFAVLMRHARARRAGAFEQAARELHVDRSVLRRRVQALSAWVGLPLLEGRGPALAPTAAGGRLLERGAHIESLVSGLHAEVTEGRQRVVIGCTGTIATELVPDLLLALERDSRPIELAVRRAGGSACERLVQTGELDLGVIRGRAPVDLSSLELLDDRLFYIVPASHSLARTKAPTLEQMAALPLVLYGEASRTRGRVMDRLGPLGARIRIEIDGRAAALSYVRAGIGASFLSLLPGHLPSTEGVKVWDVTSLFAPSKFWVIAKKDRWNEEVVQRVVHELSKGAGRRSVTKRARRKP